MSGGSALPPDAAHLQALIAFRHDLHAHPELRFEEHRTAARIAERLRSAGYAPLTGMAGTGVVATLHGAAPGPAILLRAELDALPIAERTNLPWASRQQGRMHACGHDGHATMLLGAAECLARAPPRCGSVHFVFQPGEEGGAGARAMMNEGLFEKFRTDACFSLHNWPGLARGHLALRDGPIMAGGRRVRITITGRGSHAGQPHLGADPIVAAACIIRDAQLLVSRRIDPAVPAVVSICTVHAGETDNIIPDEAVLTGTIRALSEPVLETLCDGLKTVAAGVGLAHGIEVLVEFHQPYPVTVNHPAETDLAARAMEMSRGEGRVNRAIPPNLTSEDFGFMLQSRAGAYVLIGNGLSAGLHSAFFDFDDALIADGIAYWLSLVRLYLAEGSRREVHGKAGPAQKKRSQRFG